MPTPTYTPLGKFTVTSNTTQVSITNIDQNYLDLILVCDIYTDSGGDMEFRYNYDGSVNYGLQSMGNNQSSREARSQYLGYMRVPTGGTDGANVVMHIKDYSKTNKYKSAIIAYTQNTESFLCNTRYRSTSAITTITFNRQQSVLIAPGTTVAIYGLVG